MRAAVLAFASLVGCHLEEAVLAGPDAADDPPSPDAAVLSPDPAPLPDITSGDGITVVAIKPVSGRTIDIHVSTTNVGENATAHGNAIRVTLPPDYATSGKRYPVIFDLHGSGASSYASQWSGGAIETVASGTDADVIVVMPDGGKNGWYTDWVDQSIVQNWKTYHLTQLIPFIDRNLRTLGTREGRGIIGLSMGGFGAIRYAVDRPDLFAAVGSMSGAMDLDTPGVQGAVVVPSALFGLPPFGAFGAVGIFSPLWGAVNPVRRADRLATVATFLVIGAGTDPGELIVRDATYNLHRALDAAGVSHTLIDYGIPGQTASGNCTGGHTPECALHASALLVPRILGVLADAQ